MKNLLSAALLSAAMGMGATAFAEGSECSSSKKVADAGSCASACADKESMTMAKGGAAEDNTVSGYSLGQKVPEFTLSEASGKEHKLSDFAGKPVVLVFYNQNCPYVVEVKDRLNTFSKTFSEKGVVTVAIDAGVDKGSEDIAEYAKTVSYPILVNPTSEVAVNFGATKTPEVYILNQQGVIVYHGAFDNGQKGGDGNRKAFAEDAITAVLAGQQPEVTTTKAFGCSIKFNPSAKKAAAEKMENKTEKTS